MLAGSIRTGHWRFFTSTGLQSSPHRCHRVAPRVEIEIESPAQVAARATPPFPVCCRPPSPSQSTASGALQKKAVTDSPISEYTLSHSSTLTYSLIVPPSMFFICQLKVHEDVK